jgi:hypothetical protein
LARNYPTKQNFIFENPTRPLIAIARPHFSNHLANRRAVGKALTMAGYSGTPLPQKLGIKPGATVVAIDEPPNYRKLLGKLDQVTFSNRIKANSDFVHLFTKRRSELESKLSILRRKISDNGTIWVSWPKKSAKVPTDITEDVVREVALPLGLVDIKVCAVDETWSGLKLMIRRENRKSK